MVYGFLEKAAAHTHLDACVSLSLALSMKGRMGSKTMGFDSEILKSADELLTVMTFDSLIRWWRNFGVDCCVG
jgi:hypothetical protein